MDLISQQFGKSPLLGQLPGIDFCEYKGETPGGFQRFLIKRGNEELSLIVSTVIRAEEDLIWKSCDELLGKTLKEAAVSLQGFFGFELLSIELGEAIRNFQWAPLRQLLINHARTLKVGEEKLIRYTSLYGILKKRVEETWGKMEYGSHVSVFRKPSAELDLWIKKILKDGAQVGGKLQVLLYDLSQDPIFRFGEEDQTSRLEKFLKKGVGALPLIYISDSRGLTELGMQFKVGDHV